MSKSQDNPQQSKSDLKIQYNEKRNEHQNIQHQSDEQSSYSRCIHPKNKLAKKKTIRKKLKSTKNHGVGEWDYKQNKRYVDFIKKNRDIIDDPVLRKNKTIYKKMSNYIRTRTADQCRGHHIKKKNKYGTLDSLIHNVSKLVQENKIIKTPRKQIKLVNNEKEKPQKPTLPSYQQEQQQYKYTKIKLIIDASYIKSWYGTQN